MKKIVSIILILILSCTFSGCMLNFGEQYPTIDGIELYGSLKSYDVGKYTFIEGNLENTTNEDVTDYAVLVEVYDEYGNYIITASKINQTLIEAGDTKYFSVRFNTSDLSGNELDLEKCKVLVVTQETYDARYN